MIHRNPNIITWIVRLTLVLFIGGGEQSGILVVVDGQNPRCYLCYHNPLARFQKPRLIIDVTSFNILSYTAVSCHRLNKLARDGNLTADQCSYLTSDPYAIATIQIPCNCTNTNYPPTPTTVSPTTVSASPVSGVPVPTPTTVAPVSLLPVPHASSSQRVPSANDFQQNHPVVISSGTTLSNTITVPSISTDQGNEPNDLSNKLSSIFALIRRKKRQQKHKRQQQQQQQQQQQKSVTRKSQTNLRNYIKSLIVDGHDF